MLGKFQSKKVNQSFTRRSHLGKFALVGAGLFLGGALLSSQTQSADADEALHPPQYPWSHRFPWQAFDHASIRRGHQVYKTVCATCHSLDRIAYRNLVDVCYTEEEVKAMASEVDVLDGPNGEGDMFERPGKLSDYMPRPYANENAARYSNNGAYPPDLSLVVKAREAREDYMFALLTGYREPPHGVEVRQGLFYNPYFPGGAIAMPQALIHEQIQFDDGTSASISQMAKDVSTFLAWAAEPEHDDRKRIGMKALLVLGLMAVPTFYFKKLKWAPIKTKAVAFKKL